MDVDKENTMRSLKDEPHIMRFWCRLGFHRWTIWYLDETIRPEQLYGKALWKIWYTQKCIHCSKPKWKIIKKPKGG